jgi:hypothetical protein
MKGLTKGGPYTYARRESVGKNRVSLHTTTPRRSVEVENKQSSVVLRYAGYAHTAKELGGGMARMNNGPHLDRF